jgi:hypothetical protein
MLSNCGAIRYLVTRPFLTAYICHCHLCQKRTGSAFSLSVVLPADGLELVSRGTYHRSRSSELSGDGVVERGLFTESELAALTSALEGYLDDPNTLVTRPLLFQAWGRKLT